MDVTRIKELLREIEALVDGGASTLVTDPPAGMVAVYPTGPEGAGKVRYYPTRESLAMPDTGLLGYVSQIAELGYGDKNAQGRYFLLPDAINTLAAQGRFAECVDRVEHPRDWMTAVELEMEAKLLARDRATGRGFSPQ
jgi:hypothetical protein